MKVLFVNLVYGVGSTGKIIADIMDLLKSHGHKVKVLYGSGPNINNDDAIKYQLSQNTIFIMHCHGSPITQDYTQQLQPGA